MLKKILGIIILSILSYFQMSIWQLPAVGWFFLCLYLLITYRGFYLVLVRIFDLSVNIYTKLLGAFCSLFVLGLWLSWPLFFNYFQNEVIALIFLMNGLVSLGVEKYLINYRNFKSDNKKIVYLPKINFPFFKFLSFIFLIAVIVGFYLLYTSKTSTNILSPWQTINSIYIYIFWGTTLILGILIFTKLKIKTLLLFLILQSFLLHLYLPLTQEYFYGADQWRHTAVEERIVNGLDIIPGTSEESTKLISNFSVGKLSYGNFWGVSSFLSKILQIDLINLNKWFLPILWSLILPILLLELGSALRWGRKESLFLVWCSLLPFSLQAVGAMTLPVSYGFLFFVLNLVLLIKYLRSNKKEQLLILGLIGILLSFQYLLYFILFWLNLISVYLFNNFLKKRYHILTLILIIILVSGSIIALEILTGYSYYEIKSLNDYLNALKQVLGNLGGWYLATGPRVHTILTGNILFNQIPTYAFVENIFTRYLFVIPLLALGFWMSSIIGLIKSFLNKNSQLIFISTLTVGLTISYIISRYFLNGENILTRRLDIILGLLFTILFVYGLFNILKKELFRNHYFLLLIILLLSFATTISYSLGPNTNTVSQNEYQAMEFVWKNEMNNKQHCVFANVYPLLSLEAISKKEIIGGGLPIDKYFVQTELNTLYNDILVSDNFAQTLEKIKNVCPAKSFWVLADNTFKADKFIDKKIKKFDKFNELFIWQIEL